MSPTQPESPVRAPPRRRSPLAIGLARSAVVLLPLCFTLVLLASELRQRPAGRTPLLVSGTPSSPLVAGWTRTFQIPNRGRCRAVTLWPQLGGPPTALTFRVCVDAVCEDVVVSVSDSREQRLVLSQAPAGAELSLSVISSTGGSVALRRDAPLPAIELVQGFSWRYPFARMLEFARADGLGRASGVVLALGALALAGLALFAAGMAVSGRAR